MTSSRNLTVMFTDLTGYTQAMSEMSREQIDRFLSAHDRIVRPVIQRSRGKVIKTGGDSFLAVFESPTDAVLAGIQIQSAVDEYNKLVKPEERMEIRVSINVGEVTEKDGDVFGDAVNVASRLLSVAEKNEVYFTEAVYLVMNKREVPTAEVGYRQFKGVPEKIKVYRVLREKPVPVAKEEPEPVPFPQPAAPAMAAGGKKTHWLQVAIIALFSAAIVSSIVAAVLQFTAHRPKVSQEPPPAQSAAPPVQPSPSPISRKLAGKPGSAAAKSRPKAKPKPVAEARPKAKSQPKSAVTRSKSVAFPPPPKLPAPKQLAESAPAMMEISSSPSGAEVYVDGEMKGRTSIIFPLKPGSHEFKLVKRGYEDKEVILPVHPGINHEVLSLEKR